jgi:hypothetical protein
MIGAPNTIIVLLTKTSKNILRTMIDILLGDFISNNRIHKFAIFRNWKVDRSFDTYQDRKIIKLDTR